MTPTDLRILCQRVMLQLDTPDENAAMNAGDMLAALLVELMPGQFEDDPPSAVPERGGRAGRGER